MSAPKKTKREAPTSLRLSDETKRQLAELVQKWGTSMAQAVSRAVDRAYVAETRQKRG